MPFPSDVPAIAIMKYLSTILCFVFVSSAITAETDYGTLIFEDDFERTESQELKDEPGNEWTTSSDKTAKGNKQVDLRDGYLYIYTHAEANHATSVRHAFAFKNGTIGMKVKFDDAKDSLKLNFTDLGEKSVHAGHLFNVTVSPEKVSLTDLKTGVMNLQLRNASKQKTLTKEQKADLKTKNKDFAHQRKTGTWHQIYATVEGDEVSCTINGEKIGLYQSPGFAHETKTLIRLLVARNVCVDEVRIWRKE